MTLLATLYPSDFDQNAPNFNYGQFTPRQAGRAIIFDGEKVALVHVAKHDYYMLPGGGIEDESDVVGELAREIKEEAGVTAELLAEVGSIEVYFDRWQTKQTDTCYFGRKVAQTGAPIFTDFENSEGFGVVWAPDLNSAIALIETAHPQDTDGKLVRTRDLKFLQEFRKKWLG